MSLALISRKELVFDSLYSDYLFDCEENDPWSFYDLTGCPAEIVKSMIELAELAREFELASTMRWVSFDLTPVYAIEQRLRIWAPDKRPKSFASPRPVTSPHNTNMTGEDGQNFDSPENVNTDPDDSYEEAINSAEDQRHCIEAWRRALLIYVRRVFRLDQTPATKTPRQRNYHLSEKYGHKSSWGQLWQGSSHPNEGINGSSIPPSRRIPFFSLVRATINDIRCVRRSSQTQKQLLLPAFIAGSETSDPELRRFVCAYCDWWSNKSRYKMFDTMRRLLLQIWEEMDRPATPTGQSQQQPSASASTSMPYYAGTKNPQKQKGDCWWGSIIDKHAQTLGPEGLPIQYLFG